MRRVLLCLAVFLLVLSIPMDALADRMYVFPDSDKRRLTRAEVEAWDYESLGYGFNEIFARHGYVFIRGEKYDNYFRTMPWYTPNRNTNNDIACYPYLNNIEWDNYDLIKAVRAQKRYNDWGRSIWELYYGPFDALQGFNYATMRGNQTFPVYSAPNYSAWRGANGYAEVNTNGAVYVAGWERGWLLVMYETNSGSVRVGYITGSIQGELSSFPQLNFSYSSATVTSTCTLTDDPARTGTSMQTLHAGAQVTYLTTYFNRCAWDYVETTVNGQTARGFIRSGSLNITALDSLDILQYSH